MFHVEQSAQVKNFGMMFHVEQNKPATLSFVTL